MNDTDQEPEGQAQRKIIVSNDVTVDGCYAGSDGEIDWFVWNDETEQYSKDQLESIDTILFGRVTYELMGITTHHLRYHNSDFTSKV